MKRWKKIGLWIVGSMLLILFLIILVNPLPKFIRYQINKSVTDLNIKGIPVADIEDRNVDGIPIRVYNANQEVKPAIFYIPGGAFIAGNLDSHDNICRYLASNLDAVVVSIDYGKAPEHQYPRGLNDSEQVLNWILTNSAGLNIDKSSIVLMGDSAGGNFAAVLAQKFKEDLRGQVLINPVLDLTSDSPAYENWGMFVDWYLQDLSQSEEDMVSPLLADSFDGLPKTVIVICDADPLKLDGELYQNKLEEEGVTVVLKEFRGFGHLANLWAGTSEETKEVREFVIFETNKLFNN